MCVCVGGEVCMCENDIIILVFSYLRRGRGRGEGEAYTRANKAYFSIPTHLERV